LRLPQSLGSESLAASVAACQRLQNAHRSKLLLLQSAPLQCVRRQRPAQEALQPEYPLVGQDVLHARAMGGPRWGSLQHCLKGARCRSGPGESPHLCSQRAGNMAALGGL